MFVKIRWPDEIEIDYTKVSDIFPPLADDEDCAEDDNRGSGTSMTLSKAPNMVANLRQMYEKSLGSLATEMLQECGVTELGYELPKVTVTGQYSHQNYDLTRLDLRDTAMASAGSEERSPTHLKRQYGFFGNRTDEERQGIDWSDHLENEQYGRTVSGGNYDNPQSHRRETRGAGRRGCRATQR